MGRTRSVWDYAISSGDPTPLADERFREIEAAGQNTSTLLYVDSWLGLYEHIGELRDTVANELPIEFSLDRQVQDAGHFAALGHHIEFEKYMDFERYGAYAFLARFSLYGKLASVRIDPEWLGQDSMTVERVSYVERFIGLVVESGFEIVPRRDLDLPYTGSTFKPDFVTAVEPSWDYFFFDYW